MFYQIVGVVLLPLPLPFDAFVLIGMLSIKVVADAFLVTGASAFSSNAVRVVLLNEFRLEEQLSRFGITVAYVIGPLLLYLFTFVDAADSHATQSLENV